jgi:gluconokinase
MDERIAAGGSGVVACSALKLAYRNALLGRRPAVRIVFLDISPDVNLARLEARHGHFFPSTLLESQLGDLERPLSAEDALVIGNRESPDQLVEAIISRLGIS